MESKDIIEILENFEKQKIYKKILIDGEWGIGKTYYVEQYISERKNLYVRTSLFGKESIDAITDEIVIQLYGCNKKPKRYIRKLYNGARKLISSIGVKGISLDVPALSNRQIISQYLKNDAIGTYFVIDDLERKSDKISMADIVGFLEWLSTFEKVKLIIICDETKIEDNDLEIWKKFREKIVERTYKILNFSDEALEEIIVNSVKCKDKDSLKSFTNDFMKQHSIKNLRTVIKGVNLFDEISSSVECDDTDTRIMLLKTCLSVVIECVDELYKEYPTNLEKNSKEDKYVRIASNYFNSSFFTSPDLCALDIVYRVYDEENISNLSADLQKKLDDYKVNHKNKDLFYMSSDQNKEILNKLYNSIKDDKYEFVSLDDIVKDLQCLFIYSDILELNFNKDELTEVSYKLLYRKFYNKDKSLEENKVGPFILSTTEQKDLKDIFLKYNNEISKKYFEDKVKILEDNFKKENYDAKILINLNSELLGMDPKVKIYFNKIFINMCRNNNFLIPDIAGEIDKSSWKWTCQVCKFFKENIYEEGKTQFNNFISNIEGEMASYRVNILKKDIPLFEKDTDIMINTD